MLKKIKIIHFIFFLSIAMPKSNMSQKKSPKIKISGGFGATADFYEYSADGFTDFRARRPSNLYRFNANANISFSKYFTLPFGVNLTGGQRPLYTLPNIPNETFIDYVMNPLNRIYIGPKYKWAQVELGTQTPSYSKLTIGSMPMFGAGINLTPGKFIFSFHYLAAQRAIEPNIDSNVIGAYRRDILSAKIGFGERTGNMFAISVVKSKDDTNSVARKPIGVEAREGLVVAPVIQFKFLKKFLFSTETAGSIYTKNIESTDINTEDQKIQKIFSSFYKPKSSTKAGYANITSLKFTSKNFNIKAGFQYMSAGYETMGYPFMQNDYVDYTLSPTFILFKNKVIINGTLGLRTNNLSNNILTPTKQVLGLANLMWTPNQKFNLNATYTNFGFRNTFSVDTLKIEMITESYSLTPTLTLGKGEAKHRFGLNGAYNQVDDFNTFSGEYRKTRTTMMGFNYGISFKENPFTFSFFARNLNNSIPNFEYKSNSATVRFGYSLFDKKLKPNLSFTYAINDRQGYTPDNQMNGVLGLSLSLKHKLSFNLSYRFSNYIYGSIRNNANLTEHFIRTGFKKRF